MAGQRSKNDSSDALRKGWSLWTRSDQATIAVILVILFVLLIGSQVFEHYRSGGQIDIDQADPTTIEFSIDVNLADWPEFVLLPGIGETYARRIVESREQDGLFESHEDLQRVRGIGPKTMEKIRPYLLPIDTTQDVNANGE